MPAGKAPRAVRKPSKEIRPEDALMGITKPAIKRMARKGGVRRISDTAYEKTRVEIREFLVPLLNSAILYTTNARRKTVSAEDVIHAFERSGRRYYG